MAPSQDLPFLLEEVLPLVEEVVELNDLLPLGDVDDDDEVFDPEMWEPEILLLEVI